MEFRILGPLEVIEDGNPLPLGTLKERLVLGVLLLHANEFVSRERLIDDLWGAAPPATARKAVNVYISKLRQTLARDGHDPIATADGGYRLRVESELLDADRMRGLVARASERMADGESEAASQLLQEALAFWRGPTLAGLSLESFGRDEVAQLDELRLTVLMDRIDCDLARGRHERVLGELQVLVREHPLRERLRAQQMLALYRADRQADALEAYQDARHALIDELGIEPSESLHRLHQAILQHDPALEIPTGRAATNGAAPVPAAGVPPAPPGRPGRPVSVRRRYVLAAGLAVVAAVAVPVAVLTTGGSSRRPPSSPVSAIQSGQFARVDPATGSVAGGANVGIDPAAMAIGGNTLWMVQRRGGSVEPFDLGTGKLEPPVSVAGVPYDVAVSPGGTPWVSERKPVVTELLHTRSDTGPSAVPTETKDIAVPLPGAGAEVYGGGDVWVIPGPLRSGSRVALIDVRSRRVSAIDLGSGRQTTAIAYGYGRAWIGTYDPRTSTAWLAIVRRGSQPSWLKLETDDGDGPSAIAVGNGSVWALSSTGGLIRIDPMTHRMVKRISMTAQQPELLAVGAGFVWTTNHNGYSLSQVDPHANRIVRTVPLGSYSAVPCGLAATNDSVFVTTGGTGCG